MSSGGSFGFRAARAVLSKRPIALAPPSSTSMPIAFSFRTRPSFSSTLRRVRSPPSPPECPGAINEIRRALGTIEPFLERGQGGLGQHDWVAELAGRVVPTPDDASVVCALDTG